MNSSPWLEDAYSNAVAVIGMTGRFCHAPNLDTYWSNLCKGLEAARRISPEELRQNGCPSNYTSHPAFVPVSAQMEDVDKFDANFFGFSTGEAKGMDPQLRLMLESAWHAFENAGYIPGETNTRNTRVGVFAGAAPSLYWLCNVGPDVFNNTGTAFHRSAIITGQDFLSSWISYKFGFTGPSLNIQTACSTGLVLIATACQHLLDYSCDMALAVTATVFTPRGWGYVSESGGILSPDGHCRPFDATAGGTLPGEGAGAVVLKRLGDALADGDRIEAIIRGYGISNDGIHRAGFSAPSAEGQAIAIRTAHIMAGITSQEVGYVETHGTGTYLGDPIEIAGLSKVFGERDIPCILGSVKGNIGHLGSAAGMASLLKTILILNHGYIPPTINFRKLNPAINLDIRRFRIAAQGEFWPNSRPHIAGVSSFGLGGTNCHVVLESPPAWAKSKTAPLTSTSVSLFFSAPDEQGLQRQTEQWGNFLATSSELSLTEVAWNLRHARTLFPYRCAVTGTDAKELASLLLQGSYPMDFHREVPQLLLSFAPSFDVNHAAILAQELRQAELSPIAIIGVGPSSAPAQKASQIFTNTLDYIDLTEDRMPSIGIFNNSSYVLLYASDGTQPMETFKIAATKAGIIPERCKICLFPALPGVEFTSSMASLLGNLFIAGLNPVLPRNGARRLSLPEYPFARESYWLPLALANSSSHVEQNDAPDTDSPTAEKLVLDIWREAFGLPDLGLEDDFYVMGGTSMTAVQILANVENVFGIRIPMTEFNKIRTASQLLDTLATLAE